VACIIIVPNQMAVPYKMIANVDADVNGLAIEM